MPRKCYVHFKNEYFFKKYFDYFSELGNCLELEMVDIAVILTVFQCGDILIRLGTLLFRDNEDNKEKDRARNDLRHANATIDAQREEMRAMASEFILFYLFNYYYTITITITVV